ncbi:MAG: phosphate ABC transporter permease PstA [Phycisphaerales bacterium]|nr:phosphate ABC transporter permease PstA [Phycisphaerales bacterium]
MPSPPPSPQNRTPLLASGEPFVWLTGMGLVVGLAMVVVLLGLIVYKGLEAFWPHRVARIELTTSAQEREGAPFLVAMVIESRHKKAPGEGDREELYLQTGNKDFFGSGFRYLDADEVASISYPPDEVVIEQIEYLTIGTLVSLQRPGAAPIEAEAPGFLPALKETLAAARARSAEIEHLEKVRIGDNAARIQALRIERKRLERVAGDAPPDPAAIASIDEQTAELQSAFEGMAAEARALRAEQDASTLTYRIADGREKSIVAGQVVHVTWPNQMGFAGRLGQFFKNMWAFVSENPREANTAGGIFPALFGTFVMTVILSIAVTPFGVIAAIYLREYAKEGLVVRTVRIAINNLAGVPSIVFGVFGLGFFVYGLGGSIDRLFYPDSEGPVFGTGGILWASLTLALMTVPVVIVATEESLAAVSRGVREGSLACGASKWQTIQRVVLPAAGPGIITGMILAMARGAGEVAPLMIVGVVKWAETLPVDTTAPFLHLDRKFMHLGFHIFDLAFQSPDSEAARPMVFASTLLLITLVVTMNLGAIFIRERLRRKYATGAF